MTEKTEKTEATGDVYEAHRDFIKDIAQVCLKHGPDYRYVFIAKKNVEVSVEKDTVKDDVSVITSGLAGSFRIAFITMLLQIIRRLL